MDTHVLPRTLFWKKTEVRARWVTKLPDIVTVTSVFAATDQRPAAVIARTLGSLTVFIAH